MPSDITKPGVAQAGIAKSGVTQTGAAESEVPMTFLCADLAELLPAVDRPELLRPQARLHLEQCLRCQAEAAGYRRMRRCLASLAQHPVAGQAELASGFVMASAGSEGMAVRSPRWRPAVRPVRSPIGPALRAAAARSRLRLVGAGAVRSRIRQGRVLVNRAEAAAVGALAGVAGGVALAAATRKALRVRYRLGA